MPAPAGAAVVRGRGPLPLAGRAARGREASHQPLPKFQDQVHNLHFGLALHPDLNVLGDETGPPSPRPLPLPPPPPAPPPAQPLRAGPVAPLYSPSDSSPYRLTDGLEVQGLQLLGHLFASLSVPAIEMRGLEKPPVGAGTVALGLSPCAEGGTAPSSRCPRTSPAVHPPVEAQPVPLEDAGELGPCVLQAAQEVILAEGADLGRGLRQRPGEAGGLRGHRLTGSARGSGPHRALARRMP